MAGGLNPGRAPPAAGLIPIGKGAATTRDMLGAEPVFLPLCQAQRWAGGCHRGEVSGPWGGLRKAREMGCVAGDTL